MVVKQHCLVNDMITRITINIVIADNMLICVRVVAETILLDTSQ